MNVGKTPYVPFLQTKIPIAVFARSKYEAYVVQRAVLGVFFPGKHHDNCLIETTVEKIWLKHNRLPVDERIHASLALCIVLCTCVNEGVNLAGKLWVLRNECHTPFQQEPKLREQSAIRFYDSSVLAAHKSVAYKSQ